MNTNSTEAIRLIQSGLDKLGHAPGAIDGQWGVRTARALKHLLAVGKDDTHFFVLGGNQSDAVTVARVAKSRLFGARWPATYSPRLQRLPTMRPGEFLTTTKDL